MSTLYEKIGGEKAVDAAVDIFYKKVISDHALAPFFDGMNLDRQKKMQKAFLTVAFGGPAEPSPAATSGPMHHYP